MNKFIAFVAFALAAFGAQAQSAFSAGSSTPMSGVERAFAKSKSSDDQPVRNYQYSTSSSAAANMAPVVATPTSMPTCHETSTLGRSRDADPGCYSYTPGNAQDDYRMEKLMMALWTNDPHARQRIFYRNRR